MKSRPLGDGMEEISVRTSIALGGDATQFIVNQWEQFLSGFAVTACHRIQHLGYVTHE